MYKLFCSSNEAAVIVFAGVGACFYWVDFFTALALALSLAALYILIRTYRLVINLARPAAENSPRIACSSSRMAR